MITTKDVLYLYYKYYSTSMRGILWSTRSSAFCFVRISALGHHLIALANDSAVFKINKTLQNYDENDNLINLIGTNLANFLTVNHKTSRVDQSLLSHL